MKKLFYCFIVLLLILLSIIHYPLSIVRADEIEDIQKQIDEYNKALQMSVNATVPLEKELSKLDAKLNSIQAGIKTAIARTVELEKSIKKRETDFDIQYTLLAERVESFYKTSRAPVALFILLSTDSTSNWIKEVSYRKRIADEDKKIISRISADLIQLGKDKKQIEEDKARLAHLQEQVDKQAIFFRKEIKGAKDYQAQLTSKIAQLTSKQQQLLAEKLGSLNLPTSLGAGPLYCTDDRKIDPGFSPAFAFFTFGIPHRVGMNQYGAYGRANAGQTHEEILRAYFNADFSNAENIPIKVQGYSPMPLEEYLLGIYEIPDNWPPAALEAQAIAARSYAIAYTNNGQGEICTTQACQVYKGGNKGGNWEQAVKNTAGKVLTNGGQVIKAWYSSTDGGYTFTSGDVWESNKPWTKRLRDTEGDVGSFGDLQSKAYDRESPCFYAAQGWRPEYGKSAWLKSSEVADIVNVLLLAKKDSSVQKHLSQTDKPNPDGVDTWDAEKVKQELRSRGGNPYNNVSSVSIDWDKGLGRTTSVTVTGDAGSNNFSADEFKNFFNLRAPANIQIVGPLYNMEKR